MFGKINDLSLYILQKAYVILFSILFNNVNFRKKIFFNTLYSLAI